MSEEARSGVLFAFLVRLGRRMGRHPIGTYAAALSYYTVLSLVPIFLFVFTVGTFVVDAEELQAVVVRAMHAIFPSAEGITALIDVERMLRYRGTVSLISLLTTVWSASGMFTVLEGAVNAAWEERGRRSYLKRRVIGVLSLLGLLAWLVLAFFTRSLWHLLPQWFPPLATMARPASQWIERALAFFSVLGMNFIVFRFFPARRVNGWRAAVIAVGVSFAWMVMRELFTWALSAGLLKYPVFYGSLWVFIAPLIWAYWSYFILLVGAELQAALEEDGFDVDEAVGGVPDLF